MWTFSPFNAFAQLYLQKGFAGMLVFWEFGNYQTRPGCCIHGFQKKFGY
jgi:hypothetical protein